MFDKRREYANNGIDEEMNKIFKVCASFDKDLEECDCDYSKKLEIKYGFEIWCLLFFKH